MKKFFTVFGMLCAVLIGIGVIGFFILNHFGSQLDTQSRAYVDEIVPKIVSNWNVRALVSEASPELLQVAPKEKLELMFKTLAEKLGSLKEYKGSKGQAGIHVTPQGKFTTGDYIVEASFEKADATILVRTLLKDDAWKVVEFRVHSDALMSQ